MKQKDPDWYADTRTHNALTQLKLALWVQPLIMCVIVSYLMGFFEISDNTYIRAFAGMAVGGLTWLTLNWLIKKLEEPYDDKTIG